MPRADLDKLGSAGALDATVIIPTFNRKDVFMRTLEALAQVDYPADRWEVVVVDDGSTDGTAAAISGWAADHSLQIVCLTQSNAGPAVARNRGGNQARGDALIFIDNDIEVPPRFIRDHLETLASHPGCWVVGRIVHPAHLRKTPFGRYRDDAWESFHAAHLPDRISPTPGMTAANLSMPRKDFLYLGGFDSSFTIASCEDWELGLRARLRGIGVVYHPGIIGLHSDWAGSLSAFCERQRLYSISDVLLWHKHGTASPRYQVVLQNGPIDWRSDTAALIVKKMMKRVLASRIGIGVTRLVCRLAELVAPDTAINRRAYDVAVAVAIFRGVREGLRRYGKARPSCQMQLSAG
jgi:glycosyltransferase involved in cell wall biosynthesis